MRISDWSSDVCSSDLSSPSPAARHSISIRSFGRPTPSPVQEQRVTRRQEDRPASMIRAGPAIITPSEPGADSDQEILSSPPLVPGTQEICRVAKIPLLVHAHSSEQQTSQIQSLMRNSYARFCYKQKQQPPPTQAN